MNHLAIAQNTDEWRQARCGSLGASSVHEAIAKTKSGPAASRTNKMAALIVERLTGRPQDTYQNQAMLDGIAREPEARAAYAFFTDNEVTDAGLFRHPELDGTHASPDGLVGKDGLIEVKCPQPAQHLATLLGEPIQDKYVVQMNWQLRCSGRKWCDFVSYNPEFPDAMKLHVQRVQYDAARVAEIEKEIVSFLRELDAKLATLRTQYDLKAVLEESAA